MKIICFIASPRKVGNTAWAVGKILEGAKERGAETETFYCGDLDIKPCQGCFGCKTGKEAGCVLKDDMQKIFTAIDGADVLVLGSPLYMGQMSGQAKIFVDRLSSQFMPRFSPYYKEQTTKKLIMVFTQGNPDASMFQPYYDYT
ncbi:MAG: flavodoxin family protein, partial [Heliobacteriaceae bacterium]|nr:flavodoxin family protein [Heliobacteriaceae bacterium]